MSSQDSFGLSQQTIQAIHNILDKYSAIEKIILYGSRAKQTQKQGSDIDLALFAPSLTTTDLLKIENELDDLMLPYKIDLCLYHQIDNNELREHINRVGKVF